MIDLMDHMFANGTLVIDGLFTADFPAKHKDKVLGIPGPTWFDGAIIKNPDILNAPTGTWGAANALHWDGEPTATGNVGGGFWYGSSHSKNLACVGNVPGVRHQRTPVRSSSSPASRPTRPPRVRGWTRRLPTAIWANSDTFKDVVSSAASSIWPDWGATLSFSAEPAWAEIVAPALATGKTIASVAEEWQTRYKNDAQVNGYKVE